MDDDGAVDPVENLFGRVADHETLDARAGDRSQTEYVGLELLHLPRNGQPGVTANQKQLRIEEGRILGRQGLSMIFYQ